VAYLGFSGETGEVTDNQDIISVNTHNLYDASGTPGAAANRGGSSGRGRPLNTRKKSGGWGWFFFKVILFGGAVGGSYVGYTIYRSNKRQSRF
jgi:mannose-binding lectin 2